MNRASSGRNSELGSCAKNFHVNGWNGRGRCLCLCEEAGAVHHTMGIIGEIIRLDKKSFFLISIILTILYGSKQWKLHVFKRLRSFYAENFGSVDQWAAKLPAIKLKEWFDPGRSRTQADRFECGQGWKEDFFFRPPTLTASNFAALWPTDSKFSAIKDLNLLKK